jgi:hypothetical protein
MLNATSATICYLSDSAPLENSKCAQSRTSGRIDRRVRQSGETEERTGEMTKVRLSNGQEMTVDADESDVEFIQVLITLNDKITDEINLLAKNLRLGVNAGENVEPLNRLKAAVGELHAILSNTKVVEPTQ